MKILMTVLILLLAVPVIAASKNAAPYTDEALQKINQAITDTPKVEPDKTAPRAEYHKQNVEYFNTVFEKAGYSFSGTIDQIVEDMKKDPKIIPEDRETVYNRIFMLLHIMMYECDADKIDCLQYYPPQTRKSIDWFLKNSGFSSADHERTK